MKILGVQRSVSHLVEVVNLKYLCQFSFDVIVGDLGQHGVAVEDAVLLAQDASTGETFKILFGISRKYGVWLNLGH